MFKIRHPPQATRHSHSRTNRCAWLRRGGKALLEAAGLAAMLAMTWLWLAMLAAL